MADDEDDSKWRYRTEEVASEDGEAAADDTTDEDDGEWRYSLSDLDGDEEGQDDQSAVGGNVFGSFSSDTEIIEAGSPNLENTLFVIVGMLVALVFFVQFYLLIT